MTDPTPPTAQAELLAEFLRRLPESRWPDFPEREQVLAAASRSASRFARLLPFLESSGWLRSVKLKRAVDSTGAPLPWYTYPAISFLSEKDLSDLSVFEFGSGGSTLWWADRARQVTSVEHDQPWADEVRTRLPASVEYHYEALEEDGAYSRAAAATGRVYDVVVIDGRDRVNCCRHSIASLSTRGVVIWDNAERKRYRPGADLLASKGFRRLNFRGLGPIAGAAWLTSIFYRDGNCLGI